MRLAPAGVGIMISEMVSAEQRGERRAWSAPMAWATVRIQSRTSSDARAGTSSGMRRNAQRLQEYLTTIVTAKPRYAAAVMLPPPGAAPGSVSTAFDS